MKINGNNVFVLSKFRKYERNAQKGQNIIDFSDHLANIEFYYLRIRATILARYLSLC